MKKLFTLIFAFGCLLLSAQSATAPMTGNAATLNGSQTKYVTIAPAIFYEQVSFQAVVAKDSGTVAGYALLQYSNDGTNYIDANTDTLSNTNVTTNTKVWPVAYNSQYYYRIKFVGSGTMYVKIYGYFLGGGGHGKRLVSNMLSSYSLTSDTCTNTGTTYVEKTVSYWHNTVSIHCVVTKISGTVAGTVTVQGSVDGTNYVAVNSSFITSSTLSPTNQTTNHKIFVVTGSPYKYYRLSYTGSGTMAATIKGYLVANR